MKKLDLTFAAIRVPVDAAMIILAGWTAYWIRISDTVTEYRPVLFDIDLSELTRVMFGVAMLWIFIFAINKLYSIGRRSILEEVTQVFYAVSTGMMVVFTAIFFSQEIFESRFIVLAAWVLAMIFIIIARILLRGLQRSMHSLGYGLENVIIIGTAEAAKPLMDEFQLKPSIGVNVLGRKANFDNETRSWVIRTKKKQGVDRIILADPDINRKNALALRAFCDQYHIGFFYTADLLEATTSRLRAHAIAGIPLFEVQKTSLIGWGRIYKRTFDIVFSIILIILTLPIQIVTVIILLFERQGGVMLNKLPNGKPFTRIGEGGKPFKFKKYRSMVKDAHKLRYDKEFISKHNIKDTRKGSPLSKFEKDPRITPYGRFMRAASIDEIPQFYNVLLGNMSLVGPRPHLPEEVDKYQPGQLKVLTIKPGITGMAQVSGRADLDFNDEVTLDIFYIENWTPWLDLAILVKTPIAVLKGIGAS
jgi:exopolysaccharide biosynthesis polyprenyl glycosylphosphotransferase